MPAPPSRAAAGLILILSVCVIAYTLRYIAAAIATGSVPGKLGAVYHAPDFHFYAFTALSGIGTLLGFALLYLSIKWIRRS